MGRNLLAMRSFSFFYKKYAAQDIPHAGSSRGSTKISFTATHSGCVAA